MNYLPPEVPMPCRDCGRPGTSHCTSCQRTRRGTTNQRGYGVEHRRARSAWAERIEAGERPACRRCGEPIEANDRWDLGHQDDRLASTWPEHRSCNRATNRPNG